MGTERSSTSGTPPSARTHLSVARSRLLTVDPTPGAHRVAIRAAATMLLALGTLAVLDRLELAAYVTFGAFASVYGGRLPTSRRWHTQLTMAGVLLGAVAAGAGTAMSADRRWVAIPVVALCAGLAAALSDRYRWRPPGPMFVVFAAATCAAIPTSGTGLVTALVAAASAATVAVALGAGEALVGRAAAPHSHGATPVALPRHRRRLQAVRCCAAVAVAGSIATAAGIGHPYWAMVAAVVPLSVPQLGHQLARGVHRVAGTVVGLLLAAGLLALPLSTAGVVLVVVALQGIAELLVGRHYGAALVFITPLALLVGQLAVRQSIDQLLRDRLSETVIGVVVGLVTAVLTRDRSPGPGVTAPPAAAG